MSTRKVTTCDICGADADYQPDHVAYEIRCHMTMSETSRLLHACSVEHLMLVALREATGWDWNLVRH